MPSRPALLFPLRRAPEDALRLDHVIQDETLDLFYFPESMIVADEACGSGVERRGELDGIRCSQTIAGSEFGGLVRDVEVQGQPGETGVRWEQGIEGLDETIILQSVRLHQRFQQGDGRRDRNNAASFDSVKQRRAPGPILGVGLNEINQDVCIEADSGVVREERGGR